jgi:TolB-like protein/Flp pilus assembly protein TadD
VLTLALVAAFGWRGSSGQAWPLAGDSLATVAVLPCVSYANLAEHRELGDSLAAELIHRLGRLRALTVIARSSSFPLRDAPLTAREIGERLGATHLVSCSIRRAPDGVRIGAELVDTASGAQRWSAEYDRSGDDPMQVVDELAVGLSERLLDQLAGPERAQLIRHGSSSPEAVRAVAQARELAQQQTAGALGSARDAVTAALRLDPDYADAYVALAELDLVDAQIGGRASEIVRAEAQARLQQALVIDAEFAPALALRSRLQCEAWEWTSCGRDSARALELEPGSARVQAAAAAFHLAAGSRDRAVDHATRALRIDPESAANWRLLALAYLHAGRAEDALALAQRAAERFPELWAIHDTHALVLQQIGRCGAALAPLQRALALAPGDPGLQAREAALQACEGRREGAVSLLRGFELRRAAGEPVGDHALALCHLALGQKAQALDALEAMQAARDPRLVEWVRRPLAGIDLLADEPRWSGLVAALNFPAEGANRSAR